MFIYLDQVYIPFKKEEEKNRTKGVHPLDTL